MIDLTLANIEVEKIIIHIIYARDFKKALRQPKYADSVIVLDDDSKDIITERLKKVMGRDSHCVRMRFSTLMQDSPYSLIDKLVSASYDEFVTISKLLADSLNRCQSPYEREEAAIFVICGNADADLGKKFVCIIKADAHRGLSLLDETSEISVETIKKLILSPSNDYVKIGFFTLPKDLLEEHTSADYEVSIFDENIHKSNPNLAADYFAKSFLGLGFLETDPQLNREFFVKTTEFINSLNIDDNDKVDLRTSLYSYLKTFKTETIDIEEFANTFLPQELRDSYHQRMETANFPLYGVHKNLTYLHSELSRRKLTFTSNVQIQVPSENFDEIINIISQENDRTVISIKGKLKNDQ